jgi:hypothetical protein
MMLGLLEICHIRTWAAELGVVNLVDIKRWEVAPSHALAL